jgi:hypothetical protein
MMIGASWPYAGLLGRCGRRQVVTIVTPDTILRSVTTRKRGFDSSTH